MAYSFYVFSENSSLLSDICFEAMRNIIIEDLYSETDFHLAEEFFTTNYCDVLIIDFNICSLSYFDYIEKLKRIHKDICIVMLVDFINPDIKKILTRIGAGIVLQKPINSYSLINLIVKTIKVVDTDYEKLINIDYKVEQEITKILNLLEFKTNFKGYRFVKAALKIIYNLGVNNYGMTTIIYPHIATTFNTTSERVERILRHTINVAYQKYLMNSIEKNEITTLLFAKKRPTNSEFVSVITNYLTFKKMY